MDSNNVSNLFRYLKDKYGEESVSLLRLWEFAVKMDSNKVSNLFSYLKDITHSR